MNVSWISYRNILKLRYTLKCTWNLKPMSVHSFWFYAHSVIATKILANVFTSQRYLCNYYSQGATRQAWKCCSEVRGVAEVGVFTENLHLTGASRIGRRVIACSISEQMAQLSLIIDVYEPKVLPRLSERS